MRMHLVLAAATAAVLTCGGAAHALADPSMGKAADNAIYAQTLVNEQMAKHSELLVLGLHAPKPGAKDSHMIAANLDRIGKADDEDDLAVAQERKTILAPNLKEPTKFEVAIPLKDASGKVERWAFEAGTPSGMIRNGFKPGIIKQGVEVTIKGFHARDLTQNTGMLRELVLADGTSYGMFGSQQGAGAQ